MESGDGDDGDDGDVNDDAEYNMDVEAGGDGGGEDGQQVGILMYSI
jgi:hypothetical protein